MENEEIPVLPYGTGQSNPPTTPRAVVYVSSKAITELQKMIYWRSWERSLNLKPSMAV